MTSRRTRDREGDKKTNRKRAHRHRSSSGAVKSKRFMCACFSVRQRLSFHSLYTCMSCASCVCCFPCAGVSSHCCVCGCFLTQTCVCVSVSAHHTALGMSLTFFTLRVYLSLYTSCLLSVSRCSLFYRVGGRQPRPAVKTFVYYI